MIVFVLQKGYQRNLEKILESTVDDIKSKKVKNGLSNGNEADKENEHANGQTNGRGTSNGTNGHHDENGKDEENVAVKKEPESEVW